MRPAGGIALSFLLTVTAVACAAAKESTTMTPSAAPSPLAADAVAGIHDPALRDVVAAQWELAIQASPTWATTVGDHRYDDRADPRDQGTTARLAAAGDALLARAQAIDPVTLDDADRITRTLLVEELGASKQRRACHFEEWSVQAGGGSLVAGIAYLAEMHRYASAHDGETYLARLAATAHAVDDDIANLRRGLAAGRVSSKEVLRRVLEQLDVELAKPHDDWAVAGPGAALASQHPGWSDAEVTRFGTRLAVVVTTQLDPALRRYRAVLADEAMPVARGDVEGLAGLPDGAACYTAQIRTHVGLPKTAAELHALGEAEIARSDRALAALATKVLGTRDLASALERLRTDPALYFGSAAEIEAAARAALARSKAAIPQFFHLRPKTDCVVSIIPDYEAPYATIAYYREPHYDGSKPGEYFINTYQPTTRPRFEMEALTWHESIPGHHLQIAIAQELGDVPAFRKFGILNAFVEGWALYVERLADEMGLYSSDLDRLGQLSFDAWRGSRLVVDTGLHALGWTRAQAESYLLAHTALSPSNIRNEVDRYITWPGQALAYKVGQLEILRLRTDAKARLGARFDIKAFHDVVLGAGAVSLTVLDERIEAWIAGGLAKP